MSRIFLMTRAGVGLTAGTFSTVGFDGLGRSTVDGLLTAFLTTGGETTLADFFAEGDGATGRAVGLLATFTAEFCFFPPATAAPLAVPLGGALGLESFSGFKP
ncbi:MAG: hypothetical protein ACKN9U_15195, partial [Pirellulaceae bacterium]